MTKKIKVLTLSDHPMSPSGVGTQTKYMIEALLDTGKFQVYSFGGAIAHEHYDVQDVESYGEDWIIKPIDGYGNQNSIREFIHKWKPDILWFMTDPRFYPWLWEIENEVRPHVPMVYYHVWDNYPYPDYNRNFYLSNDFVATISKVTDDIVKTVAPEVESMHIPHAVSSNIFKKLDEKESQEYKKESLPENCQDKFIFFWNNRNAKRKMSG